MLVNWGYFFYDSLSSLSVNHCSDQDLLMTWKFNKLLDFLDNCLRLSSCVLFNKNLFHDNIWCSLNHFNLLSNLFHNLLI